MRESAGRQVLDHRCLLAFEKIKTPIFTYQFAVVPGILNKEGAGADGRVAQIWKEKIIIIIIIIMIIVARK